MPNYLYESCMGCGTDWTNQLYMLADTEARAEGWPIGVIIGLPDQAAGPNGVSED